MKRFMNRKVVVVGVAVGLTLGIGGAAFAYFSSTGSGSGTATATGAGSISIASDAITGLAPGAGSQPVNFTLTASVADSYVNTVTASIPTHGLDVTSDGTTDVPGCLASWFSLGGNPATVNHEVDLGTPYHDTSTGMTITLNNVNSDQTVCENATVYVSFTSS